MNDLVDRLLSVARYASEPGLMVWEARQRLDEFHRIATPAAITAILSSATGSAAQAERRDDQEDIPSPVQGWRPDREAVARIIHSCDEPGELKDAPLAHQRFCFKAADAILSLGPPSEEDKEDISSVAENAASVASQPDCSTAQHSDGKGEP